MKPHKVIHNQLTRSQGVLYLDNEQVGFTRQIGGRVQLYQDGKGGFLEFESIDHLIKSISDLRDSMGQ